MNKHEKLIWHYTSLNTFAKLFEENSKLYATHYCFLNDNTEYTYAINIFLDMVKKSSLKNYYKFFTKYFSIGEDMFLFCLSGAKDSLYQWRSYTPAEGGVAIGFSPKIFFGDELTKIYQTERTNRTKTLFSQFTPCIYSEKKCRTEFNNLIKACKTGFNDSIVNNIENTTIPKRISQLASSISLQAICYKNPSFKFEKEVRVIYHKVPREEIHYVGGKPRVPLPYINPQRHMQEVMISPHGDMKRNHLLVELLRDSQTLKFLITNSKSSFNGK